MTPESTPTLPTETSEPSSTDEGMLGGSADLRLSDVEEGLASLPRARLARWLGVLAPALASAIILYRWEEKRDRMLLGGVAILTIVALIFIRNPTKRLAKRVFNSLSEEARHVEIRVDSEGIRLGSSGGQTDLPWSSVWKVTESRNTLLVFVSRTDAQIVPKRAFSEQALGRFREWVRTSVTPRREPWLTPDLRRRLTVWLVLVTLATIAMMMANR
jgi:hypothetical protein